MKVAVYKGERLNGFSFFFQFSSNPMYNIPFIDSRIGTADGIEGAILEDVNNCPTGQLILIGYFFEIDAFIKW